MVLDVSVQPLSQIICDGGFLRRIYFRRIKIIFPLSGVSFWSFLPCGSPVVWFLPFHSCACGVLLTVAIGGPFSPLVGTYCMPLGPYAVGDGCVTEFAKLTYIPCMLFFPSSLFFWKSISTPLNVMYRLSVCSHSHKITVTVDFATCSFSPDKDREVVTVTIACEHLVAFLLIWREVERLPSAWRPLSMRCPLASVSAITLFPCLI